jgi:hypothetical protein
MVRHQRKLLMHRLEILFAVVAFAMLAAACVTPTLAPGADRVRITKNAPDVAACSAVGNIKVARNSDDVVDIATAETEFRNQTVGHGGNAAFVTLGALGVPFEGIAYHCP